MYIKQRSDKEYETVVSIYREVKWIKEYETVVSIYREVKWIAAGDDNDDQLEWIRYDIHSRPLHTCIHTTTQTQD